MKSFSLLLMLWLVWASVFSQDLRPLSLYNYDPKLINPAYAGLLDEQNYQVQYNGIIDSEYPAYTALTGFSLQLSKLNSGIGVFLWREEVGGYTEKNASFLYNYQIKFGNKNKLSIGTEIRYSDMSIDYSKFRTATPDDPLRNEISHDKIVIADFGVVYKAKSLSIGMSTQNLARSHKPKLVSDYHFYSFYAAYELPVCSWLVFKPSAFFRTPLTSSQYNFIELNGLLEFKKLIFIGMQTSMGSFTSYQSYSAGITIAKRVQLIGIVYSGIAKRFNTNNLELMARVVIPNKANDE